MIILLNLISLNNNIAQFDDRAVRRPRGATTARHDRAGWTGKNLILDEALVVLLPTSALRMCENDVTCW